MTYWIVFALWTLGEEVVDLFLAFWWPLYWECKVHTQIIRSLSTMLLQAGMLLWLLLPSTRGSTLLYRRLVHPTLVAKEKEIDAALDRYPSMFKLLDTDTQCYILDGGRRVTRWG